MKLFHCVVVLGAAVGGCGARSSEPSTRSEAGSGGAAEQSGNSPGGAVTAAGGSGAVSAGGSAGSLFVDPDPLYPYCHRTRRADDDPNAPAEPADCSAPQQFICDQICRCQTSAPLVPTDCANPSQFTCLEREPDCGCVCDPTGPLTEQDCSHGWSCVSYDPPVDCQCRSVIL